jgi:tRNA pseudouridine55 synthase
MDGVINVLKPPGMTSHDVVNYIRRLAGIKKAGHTGTLDPGAAGVLLVCCGKATRLIEYLDHDKRYRAEITFGITSSTGDSFGKLQERDIPEGFSKELVSRVLPSFTGRISQVPPMTSAVRHRGKKLYELARQGVVVERKARKVKVYAIDIARWYDGGHRPRALLDISCSAGTYIRVLCHDIGEKLGCGAYMSFLLRTGAGGYSLNSALTLEELEYLADRGGLSGAAVSIEEVLSFFPSVEINSGAVKSVLSGATLHLPGVSAMTEDIRENDTVVLTAGGKILAVAGASADTSGRLCFKPKKVIV